MVKAGFEWNISNKSKLRNGAQDLLKTHNVYTECKILAEMTLSRAQITESLDQAPS